MPTLISLPAELIEQIGSHLPPKSLVNLNSTSIYLHNATNRIMNKSVHQSASTVLDIGHSLIAVTTNKVKAEKDAVYARRALKILSGFATNSTFGHQNITTLMISGDQSAVQDKTFRLLKFKHLTHLEILEDTRFCRLSHLRSLVNNHATTLTSLIVRRVKIDEAAPAGKFWIDLLKDVIKYLSLTRFIIRGIIFTLPAWHAQAGQKVFNDQTGTHDPVVGKLQFVGRMKSVRPSYYGSRGDGRVMRVLPEAGKVTPGFRLLPWDFEGSGEEYIKAGLDQWIKGLKPTTEERISTMDDVRRDDQRRVAERR